jgi:hypothetical protein
VKAGKDNIKFTIRITGKLVCFSPIHSLHFRKKREQVFYFEVTPPTQPAEAIAKSIVTVADKRYDKNQVLIEYPHITKQQVLKPAEAKFIKLDLKTNSQKIGYIMGAGDEVPERAVAHEKTQRHRQLSWS